MKNLSINAASKKSFKKGGFKKNENQKGYHKRNQKVFPTNNNNPASGNDNTCYFCKKEGHMKKDCNRYKAWLSKKEFTVRRTARPEEQLYLGTGDKVQVESVGTF